MPSEIVPPVTSQPVPQAPISDGKANNVRVDGLAALLAKAAVPEASAAAPDAPVEEVQNDSPQEAQPTEATSDEAATPVEAKTEADEEVLSHDSLKLSPEQQAKIDKRIGKEVAKRKALEEELTKIRIEAAEAKQKAQVQEAPPVVHQPTPDNPLANINDVNALIQEQKDAKDVKRWAEEALDSDNLDNGVQYGDRVFSKGEVKTILRNAQRTLEDHIPQRHQFLQARQQAETTARNLFPWMADKSTPEYQQYTASFRNKAYINNDPESPYLVALAIEGLKAVNARQAAEAAKKAPAKAAPKAPSSQTAVSSTTTRARATDDVVSANRVREEVSAMKSKKNFSASDAAMLLSKTASLKSR